MRLSVVILTWNNIKALEKTLEILKEELFEISHEIIIVDNGSDDGCQRIATINNYENMGVSVGKNQGIDLSTGDFVLMLDGDIVPVRNSVQCLYNYLIVHEEVDAIGFPPNKFTAEWGKQAEWCSYLQDVKVVSSSNMYYGMVRRKVFDLGLRMEVGGPFSGPGYGWEERDFYMQLKKAGILQYAANINNAQDRYYHDINSSIKLMGKEKYISSSKERHEFFKKKWDVK